MRVDETRGVGTYELNLNQQGDDLQDKYLPAESCNPSQTSDHGVKCFSLVDFLASLSVLNDKNSMQISTRYFQNDITRTTYSKITDFVYA